MNGRMRGNSPEKIELINAHAQGDAYLNVE